MDRLTFEVHDGGMFVKESDVKTYTVEDEIMHTGNAVRKLAEYEVLEEQGKLLKLPCAAGDTVWCVQMHSGGGRVPNWGEVHQSKFSIRMYDDFGKTVFLTREEAEAALKELERGKGE